MTAIGKGLGTTRKVILTIPFPGQGGRKTRFPQPGRAFFVQGKIFGPLEEVVEGAPQSDEHPAAVGLDKPWIDVLFIKASSKGMVATSRCRQRRHDGRHDALSISGPLP